MKFVVDHLADREGIMDQINQIIDKSKVPQVITIENYLADYTDEQRRALFGLAYKIIESETGNEKDDLHDYFCGSYFGWRESDVMGMRKKKPIRTTTRDEHGKKNVISTKDLAQMFEFVQRVASTELGIYIPDPDKNWKKRMMEESTSINHG